jgi:hypothetical protein
MQECYHPSKSGARLWSDIALQMSDYLTFPSLGSPFSDTNQIQSKQWQEMHKTRQEQQTSRSLEGRGDGMIGWVQKSTTC